MKLQGQVALDVANAWARAFGAHGTPSGLLVDGQGMVVSGMAPGMDALRELRRQALETDRQDHATGNHPDRCADIARQEAMTLGGAPAS